MAVESQDYKRNCQLCYTKFAPGSTDWFGFDFTEPLRTQVCHLTFWRFWVLSFRTSLRSNAVCSQSFRLGSLSFPPQIKMSAKVLLLQAFILSTTNFRYYRRNRILCLWTISSCLIPDVLLSLLKMCRLYAWIVINILSLLLSLMAESGGGGGSEASVSNK